MSDNLARVPNAHQLRPDVAERAGAERHIEIVAPSKHSKPRVVYALSAVTCVGAIVVAQLLLSVGISQGAYEISALRASQVELGRTADSVSEELSSWGRRERRGPLHAAVNFHDERKIREHERKLVVG